MKRFFNLGAMFVLAALSILGLLTTPGLSSATNLPANTSITGAGTSFGAGQFGATLADTGLMTVTGSGATPFTAQLREIVVRDAVTGNVDFLYQFTNISGSSLATSSTGPFDAFTTNVGFAAIANLVPGSPIIVPTDSITRDAGDTITFAWPRGLTPSGLVDTGDGSAVLAILTNAGSWKAGSIQLIDGAVSSSPGFAPAVPEPGTLLLLGFGLVGLVGAGRKFKK